MSKKLSLHAIYDVDQKTLAGVFDGGTAKEQKEAAEAQVDRFAEHIGEGPERDLRVVTISEV
jgi:hypothetical protein